MSNKMLAGEATKSPIDRSEIIQLAAEAACSLLIIAWYLFTLLARAEQPWSFVPGTSGRARCVGNQGVEGERVRISTMFVTGLAFATVAAVAIVALAGARTLSICIAVFAVAAVAVYFVSTNTRLWRNRRK